MLPGKKYTPEEIGRILLRRKWLVIVPFVLGLVATVPIVTSIPPLFRSETLIMVIPQRIPESYVKSAVSDRVEDRLRSLNEQILSRSRLQRIVQDLDLYTGPLAAGAAEDLVERMRRDITVTVQGKDSFSLAYANADPAMAQKVTRRLASLYIEENLRDRENVAASTRQFLESQLGEAKRRLVEHEKKLEQYRQRYAGQLPTQLQSNLQTIQNAQLQLQSLNESMNRAHERRLLVERQLADARTQPVAAAIVMGGGGAGDAVPVSAAEQLHAARAQLDAYKLRYMADHPDVRTLEHSIRELEAKAAEEARQGSAAPARVLTPAEAAQQKRIGDLQAELDVIDHQLASQQQEERQLKATIAQHQAKVDVLPTRESELVELTRDYSTLQQTYANLLAKREESKLASNLETGQVGELFRVLDPASLPTHPYNQVRRAGFGLVGILFGLVLGLGLVAAAEYQDKTFASEEDVLRVLQLPVLTVVPRIVTASEGRGWRERLTRISPCVVALAVAGPVIALLLRG